MISMWYAAETHSSIVHVQQSPSYSCTTLTAAILHQDNIQALNDTQTRGNL